MQRFINNPRLLLTITGLVAVILVVLTIFPDKLTDVVNIIPANLNTKNTLEKSDTGIPTTINSNPITVGCPVLSNLCPEGKSQALDFHVLDSDVKLKFATWQMPKLTVIFAVFDGEAVQEIRPLSATMSSELITLTSTNGKYRAQYIFATDLFHAEREVFTTKLGTFKKGDSLALVPGLYSESADYNFQFGISFADSGILLDLPADNIAGVILP